MPCSHVPLKLSGLEQALTNQVAVVGDWTLQQLCDWVQTEHGIRVGVSTTWKTLARLDLSREKKSLHASEQTLPDVAQARAAWQASQADMPVSRLVLFDETWASTDMTPTCGRSAIDKRFLGRAP